MGSWREDDPLTRVWQLACCVFAAVLIFFFRTQVYMTLVGGLILIGGGPIGILMSLGFPTDAWILLAAPFLIIAGLIALACAVVAAPPALILEGLAQLRGTPFQYLGDGVLAVFLGLFFYGFLFPLLWPVIAPVVSHTLGEITYQRVRARVVGIRPRFRQPFYLVIGLLCLGAAVGRLILNASDYLPPDLVVQAKKIYDTLEHEVFTSGPGPRVWPKQFTVMPKQTVRTGITLTDKNQEIIVWRNADLFMSVGDEKPVTLENNSGLRQFHPFALARTGEIVLIGGHRSATVRITEPTNHGRQWFAPGETRRVDVYHDAGSRFLHDSAGEFAYRTVRRGFTGPWQPLTLDANISQAGFLEVRAKGFGHFAYRRYLPSSSDWIRLRPSQIVDTGIKVRRGDRIEVSASYQGGVHLLSPTSPSRFVQPSNHISEKVDWTGTIRLKGGASESAADVLVRERGPEWK